ncbi:MAG TPA: LuxR C-terminal-related transcriptional regulator [Roseateles sp.]|nr:LuxR C-terminal-related transcriptional regulator [Roseateles sp.]
MPPDASHCLPLLPRLVASRDLADFWHQARALLQAIAPHCTAVAWCDLQVCVLGEEAVARRARARALLRAELDTAAVPPAQLPSDDFLGFLADGILAGSTWFDDRREPPAEVQCLRLADLDRPEAPLHACLRAQEWHEVLLVPLRVSGRQMRAGLALYRTEAEGGFDAAQASGIEALRPTLTGLLARLLEQDGQRGAQADIQDFLAELPVGLMLFDWEWRPLFINDEGYRQAQLWNHAPALPPRSDARLDFRLPTALREAGERLRVRWVEDALGFAPLRGALGERVVHPLRRDMQATLTMAPARGAMARPPGLLLRFSGLAARAEVQVQPSAAQLAVLAQLTAGERNVVLLLMRGLSNQEIADALHRDISTVKDHLGHVYDKLGIRGRAQLMARLAG